MIACTLGLLQLGLNGSLLCSFADIALLAFWQIPSAIFMQPLDVQPLLEAGLLSSLVIVLYRLLYSADSASSVLAPNDSSDGRKSMEDIGDERRRVVVWPWHHILIAGLWCYRIYKMIKSIYEQA